MEPNPLLDDSPEGWDRLVGALGPATMMACIRARIGPTAVATMSAEDFWQETLLHLWRDRRKVQWCGHAALRRLVLQIAENRIRNAIDHALAQKRGGGRQRPGPTDELPPPVASTTPSRIASDAEEARAMHDAIAELPDDVREVVRLRLLEEVPVLEVAARLGLGESAVKHRLRKGALQFHQRVRELLATKRGTTGG